MSFMPNNKPVAATPIVDPNTPGIRAKEPVVLKQPDELLTERKYVANTVNNEVAVNTERLKTVVADLKGFAEGSYVQVTYFKEHYSETDIHGKYDATEKPLNNVHKSVLKIHGFEMKMLGSLSYEHDANEQISRLTGEAVTYPGFQPEKGDTFIMEIDTGKYALMSINEIPTRMSIRASTYFKIQFFLHEWMTPTEAKQLEDSVVNEAWFDKTRFLAEPGALLEHDEYVELKFLHQQRAKLVNYYRAKFLDERMMYTYMRPDGIYDPYVTDFMLNIQDINELSYYAKQLYEAAPHLKDSVWRAIADQTLPLEVVPTTTATDTHYLGSKSVLANSLINKKYIFWKDSPSLAQWLEEAQAYESMFEVQLYPKDFTVTSTEYFLTEDIFFKSVKTYYTRSGTEGSYVYTPASVKYGAEIPANVYYELKATYGFKTGKHYFTRVDGIFIPFDTEGKVPSSAETYYLYTGENPSGGGSSSSTVLTPDPTVPDITEGTIDEEKTLGDLLLHLHYPHYSECPLTDGADGAVPGTSGDGLGMVLSGDNAHIDLIRQFLLKRTIDLKKLHSCIENVWKLPLIQQFYKMPLYIFLAQKAMLYIHHADAIFDRT